MGTYALPRSEINSTPGTSLIPELFPWKRNPVQSPQLFLFVTANRDPGWGPPAAGIIKPIEDLADFVKESRVQPPKAFIVWITKYKNRK